MARQVKRGRHAADDGSFGRSAGMAAGRGTALLAVAVLLGIVLLNATDEAPRVSTGPESEETTPTTDSGGEPLGTTTTTTTAPPARLPAEVKVIAVNGAGVNGAGGRATDVLRTAGFNVLAPLTGTRGSTTAVFYAEGFEREAGAVAVSLGVPTTAVQALGTPPPVADIRGANVVVIIGADLAQRQMPAPGSSTTSTTRAAAASTTTTAAR